ncbi:MAG: potassium transporter, partial [Alcaligenes aquatilis]
MRNWLPNSLTRRLEVNPQTRTLSASPPLVLALGFMALIILGAILLSLPQAAEHRLGVFQALFMATSAVTVTGLAVIDPATDLT